MRESLHFARKVFGKRPVIGAEIGVDRGINALDMLTNFEGLSKLYLVELNPDQKPVIEEALDKEHKEQYALIIGDSAQVAKTFPDCFFDFVYIDDDHSQEAVRKSLEAWWPKIRIGGVFCGHDFYLWDEGSDVKKIVTQFFNEHNIELFTEGWDWWGIRL